MTRTAAASADMHYWPQQRRWVPGGLVRAGWEGARAPAAAGPSGNAVPHTPYPCYHPRRRMHAAMFDFAWSEIALIGIVALVAIGPKDLPVAIKAVAAAIKKARRMAGEFQVHVDEMVREANLHEVRDSINDIRRMDIKGKILDAVDGDGTLRRTVADNPLAMPPVTPPVAPPVTPAVEQPGAAPDLLPEGNAPVAADHAAAAPDPATAVGVLPQEPAVTSGHGLSPGLAEAHPPEPVAGTPAAITQPVMAPAAQSPVTSPIVTPLPVTLPASPSAPGGGLPPFPLPEAAEHGPAPAPAPPADAPQPPLHA